MSRSRIRGRIRRINGNQESRSRYRAVGWVELLEQEHKKDSRSGGRSRNW